MGNRTRKLLTVGVIADHDIIYGKDVQVVTTHRLHQAQQIRKRQKPEQVRSVLQCRQKTCRDGIRTART